MSLVDNRAAGVGAGAGPESEPGKPGVAEPSPLGASLPCVIGPLEAESSSCLLRIVELRKRFF